MSDGKVRWDLFTDLIVNCRQYLSTTSSTSLFVFEPQQRLSPIILIRGNVAFSLQVSFFVVSFMGNTSTGYCQFGSKLNYCRNALVGIWNFIRRLIYQSSKWRENISTWLEIRRIPNVSYSPRRSPIIAVRGHQQIPFQRKCDGPPTCNQQIGPARHNVWSFGIGI